MTIMTPDGMRFEPQLPVAAMKTYQLASPAQTHRRPASCEEAGCEAWQYGWQTAVDETTDLGQQQAHYIRHDRTRRHTETKRPDGLTEFAFDGGQPCFAQHTVPLERDPILIVRGGDWRGNPSGQVRRHARSEDWVDDFREHQDRIAGQIQQG